MVNHEKKGDDKHRGSWGGRKENPKEDGIERIALCSAVYASIRTIMQKLVELELQIRRT